MFFGLDLTHRRAHLYRAVLEGIALGFRDCLEAARDAGVAFAEVVAANGAGRSALLRQTLADALGVPVTWVSSGRGTVAGAALLAGLGTGVIAHAGAWAPSGGVRHEPDARAFSRLSQTLERRRALYEAVRSVRWGRQGN
jgi:xylulokinase